MVRYKGYSTCIIFLTLGPTLLMASSMSSAVTRSGSNSTEADSVSRLTSQLSTASSASSAAVILRTQDWQVMPATRTSHRSEIVLVRAVNEHSRSFTVSGEGPTRTLRIFANQTTCRL